MGANKNIQSVEEKIAELSWQLEEANDTIEAIRTGQVDALVLKEATGLQVYTLKSADHTYRVIIEKMKEGAVTLDSEGLILYSNSAFAAMANLSLSEVIGEPFIGFVAAGSREYFLSLFEKGWHSESKGEIFLSGNTVQTVPILISLTTIEIDEGTALGIIVTNLTELKETEKQIKLQNEELVSARTLLEQLNNELEQRIVERTRELSVSREHFKFLADNIPVIVWTAKPSGEVDYFNTKWYTYTAMHADESIEAAWQKFVHPEDLPGGYKAWKESLVTGQEFNYEDRLLRASDKEYRWHSVCAFPFKNDKGEIVKWLGISTDVEDQKLILASKDEFVSMVSHELKTPVTILKAFIQALFFTLNKEENGQAWEFAEKMDKQVDRLNKLIADLLEATKANAGVLLFEEKNFDFNELVKEVIDQLQVAMDTHLIEMNLSDTGEVHGDRNRLGQVISNLIINAIKYSPNSDRVIVKTSSENNHYSLCVQDFGIGIPVEQQSGLFNRFFRASQAKSFTFPGLGLGLYISNEIVKRHAGSLNFKSEKGRGSVFCMNLPLKSPLENKEQ